MEFVWVYLMAVQKETMMVASMDASMVALWEPWLALRKVEKSADLKVELLAASLGYQTAVMMALT